MQQTHNRQAQKPFSGEVAPVEVDDPFEHGAKVIATRRLDVLSRMFARRQIDEAEYQAGVKWQNLYDQAAIGQFRSIDHTVEVVDGRRMRDPLTGRQRSAMRLLGLADVAVADRFGLEGFLLYRDVLEHGRTLTTAAQMRERDSRLQSADMHYLGRLFRACLGEVAKALGHLEA